jgi:hypothetical protein
MIPALATVMVPAVVVCACRTRAPLLLGLSKESRAK